jgi:hypothetical protein
VNAQTAVAIATPAVIAARINAIRATVSAGPPPQFEHVTCNGAVVTAARLPCAATRRIAARGFENRRSWLFGASSAFRRVTCGAARRW